MSAACVSGHRPLFYRFTIDSRCTQPEMGRSLIPGAEISMLTRLIVDLYAWIIEVALWSALVLAAVLGFIFFVPMMNDAGWVIEHQLPWRTFGALIAIGVAFLLSAVLAGPLVLLVDIRRSVKAIESRASSVASIQSEESPRPRNPFAFEEGH